MEHRLHIRVRGASPYGFRLAGGRDQPVSITKLRARSKAAVAGLMEGDEIVAVNGYNCKDVSYERLIGLVEHAGHYLDLDIIRRAPLPPGAWSRDRKWSYDRADDVIGTPASVDDRRRMSSPMLDYDNVFDRHRARAKFISPSVFDREPVRPPTENRPRAVFDRAPKKNAVPSDEKVSVVWNPDKSITMSLALPDDADSKENRMPVHHERRHQQQQQQQQQRHRNESFVMMSSPAPPARVISPSPSRSLTHRVWTPRPVTPPPVQRSERSAADLWLSRPQVVGEGWRELEKQLQQPQLTNAHPDEVKFGPLPPEIVKIISPPADEESLDSLSPTHLAKKKKFADSSFFDDKTHSYPTVEEQMKMARGVAQSLTAPANQATRGHRMYMKRKEKSIDWAVDENNRRRASLDTASGDLYYNPAPWKATATWKPKPRDSPLVSLAPIPQLFAPRVPPASEEKAKYMSADEFERMRLFEDKTTHDTVPPQLCFNLAADLRQSASKGGRMFAKRRAKSDQWTVENHPMPEFQGTKAVRTTFIPVGRAHEPPDYDEVVWPGTETAELHRASMTPWQAAEQYGHVEPAFHHLQHLRSPHIPRQGTATSTHSYLTRTVNGSNHISADDDDDWSSLTQHSHHDGRHQHPFSNASLVTIGT